MKRMELEDRKSVLKIPSEYDGSGSEVMTLCLHELGATCGGLLQILRRVRFSAYSAKSRAMDTGMLLSYVKEAVSTCLAIAEAFSLRMPSLEDLEASIADKIDVVKVDSFLCCMSLIGNLSMLAEYYWVLLEGETPKTPEDIEIFEDHLAEILFDLYLFSYQQNLDF